LPLLGYEYRSFKSVQVRVVDVSRAADQPSFDEVPWLQPFPDRLLEDALLAATYAAACRSWRSLGHASA
jgi:hypothetical protein